MTVAHNLQLNGVTVTVFGRHLHALHRWFPRVEVRPPLEPSDPATSQTVLADFSLVLALHPPLNLTDVHPRVVLLDHLCRSGSKEPMARRLFDFCRDELALAVTQKANGLTAPAELQHRKHATRVVIHPTASTADKCWLKSRYVSLARRLRQRGFDPHFVVAPEERAGWLDVLHQGLNVPAFDTLGHLAAWVYESGWFIGNDSGIGHLASNLDIPTLSLFMRRGIARTWRPDWGGGHVLIGSAFIPGARFKERFWKYALTVGRVERAFARLRLATDQRASQTVSAVTPPAFARKTT
ncbi:glycosyltransferase family 9 protein [Paraburkholderia sp.]|uniref:glycosyltransferase family 9 protein n=1 Tax=Paraburkholderia sp. TaxID=1926495 RepID=UPI003D6F7CCB